MNYKTFFGILLIFALTGCVTIKRTEYLPETNDYKKICILYHHTEFRKAIIDELALRFKKLNFSVTIDSAYKVEKYPPDKFDLVIIFSGIHAFTPDSFPDYYVKTYSTSKNIIHVFLTFLTKKGVTLKLDNPKKVDTITAASIQANKTNLTEEIFKLAVKKLGIK